MSDCSCNNFPSSLGNVTFGGSVGIKTTLPVADLHIKQSSNGQFNGGIVLERSDAADQAAILLGGDNRLYLFSGGAGYVTLDTGGNVNLVQGALTVSGSGDSSFVGRVGVGTTTPTRALHLARIGGDETKSGIEFSDDASNDYRSTIIPNFSSGNPAGNKMQFLVSNGSTTGQVTSLILDGAGNALLSNPDSTLTVTSNTNATDAIVIQRSDGTHPASIATTDFGKSLIFKPGGAETVRFPNAGGIQINSVDTALRIYSNTNGADAIIIERSDNTHPASIATSDFGKNLIFKPGGVGVLTLTTGGMLLGGNMNLGGAIYDSGGSHKVADGGGAYYAN